VTAEGLENQAGLQQLLNCGCDKVQGYYFAKPMTAAQLDAWLARLPQQLSLWFSATAASQRSF
jgi:EAL domain-containing protein (putative c-di-GMP-specific phosphodiesterase class I)